jgi:cytochrome c oxidase subunit II
VRTWLPQSTLEPAGQEAERLAVLFWWMSAGAAVIWTIVVGLAGYAILARRRRDAPRFERFLIVGGGLVIPTVVLAGLLAHGLAMIPGLVGPAPAGSIRIHVTGEQWWWRVRYQGSGGATIDLANEIRLPAGEPVELVLESRDVIHSFWIPALGGKADMIPGRTTRLVLRAERPGVYRGVCAEYCGSSHAFMAFAVVVMEPVAFARWLDAQARPAVPPATPLEAQGRAAFVASGCGACHAVRGTVADGVIGPDLTHMGGRLSLAAGRLSPARGDIERWLAHPAALKPGARMPAFGMLPHEDLVAMAAYLEGLR